MRKLLLGSDHPTDYNPPGRQCRVPFPVDEAARYWLSYLIGFSYITNLAHISMDAFGERSDISAIITFYCGTASEFLTLRSVMRAVERASARGVSTEIIAVAAAEAAETVSRWLKEHAPRARLIKGDDQDRCRLWNLGTQAAGGRFVSFTPGGDLIGENWISAAYEHAKSGGGNRMLHPRHSLTFGHRYAARLHETRDDPEKSPGLSPLDPLPWSMTLLGPAAVFRIHPFSEDSAFPSEARERHWLFRLFERSITIEPVAETACFLRRDEQGRAPGPIPASPFFSRRRCRQRLGRSEDESTASVAMRPPGSEGKRLKPWQRIARTVLPDAVRLPVNRVLRRLRAGTVSRQTESQSTDRAQAVPPSLVDHWRAIHAIEPSLFPTPEAVREASRAGAASCKALSKRFVEFLADLPNEPSHLFLVRCVRQGGADRVLLNYLRALAETAPDRPVAVVATDPLESDWRHLLPENTTLVDFGLRTAEFSEEDRIRLLGSILTQAAPRVIHNIHSRIGYEVFARFGRRLNARSCLFGDLFSAGVTADGRRLSEAFDYAPRVYSHMTAFVSDHERFVAGLGETYGFAKERLQAVYQPAPHTGEPSEPRPRIRKILWASRLDREKCPELLVEIATACAGDPFEFHAFGTSLYRETPFRFERLDNLTYHGPFDGFESLRPGEYDAFLYTTLWDGLPNVLLEAAAAGLPLIAPDVGGIRELVVDGQTGVLIPKNDDAGAYAAALKRLAAHPAQATKYAENARALLGRRHSWSAYVDRLRSLSGWGLEASAGVRSIPLRKAS